jgi:phenylpropionate dioxygenase-like ring-hydroxylating dioxygenase large terminal subunit
MAIMNDRAMTFPRGWFHIGWSDELGPDTAKPLRYFGNDLVMFRSRDAKVVVLDAHCRHLGAHLGYGGRIEDGCIICPFHEWKWDSQGRHVATPYSARATQRKTLRAWHTAETAGLICLWHDPDGAAPMWGPPTIPEANQPFYGRPWPHATHQWQSVVVKPQYVTENIVDVSHLKPVHKAANPATLLSFEAREHLFEVAMTIGIGDGKPPTKLTPDGPVTSRLEATADGLGFTIFRFRGLSPTVYITTVTPVEEGTADMRLTLLLPEDQGFADQGLSRWGNATLRELIKQNERDFEIFKHLAYTPHPPFTPEEKDSYLRLRRWSNQFYPKASAKADSHDRERHVVG